MKKILSIFFLSISFLFEADAQCVNVAMSPAESSDKNYIITRIPSIPGIKDASLFANKTTCEMTHHVQYLDGLGRPVQSIQVKGSPSLNDIVAFNEYDPLGRESKTYLPYISGVNNGSYKIGDPESLVKSFYNPSSPGASNIAVTNFPFAQSILDNSPLNRVTEQGAVGDAWQLAGTAGATDAGHTKRVSYTTNDNILFDPNSNVGSRRVALYKAIINADGTRTLDRLNGTAVYSNNELFVTITKDENWTSSDGCAGTTEEYKDKEGKLILTRTYNKVGSQYQMLSSYSVYDDLGLLCFVLSPKAEADNDHAINQNILDNLCYQYRYNARRLIDFKKIPGKDWEYFLYNSKDQLVASQNGEQRGRNEWTIRKYDGFNRNVITGLWNNNDSPISLTHFQNNLADHYYHYEIEGFLFDNYPTSLNTILTVNYFDHYNVPNLPATYNHVGSYKSAVGLPTVTKINVLGTSDMLWAVNYYDDKGQLAKSFQQHYKGGAAVAGNYDEITNTFSFAGQILSNERRHFVNGTQQLKAISEYEYDHMGRLINTWETINTGLRVLLSQNSYNELGQQIAKKRHSENSGVTFLYTPESFTYNERGWLSSKASNWYTQNLKYNTLLQTGTIPQYNGSISEQGYTAGFGSQRVIYKYDHLDRLIEGLSTEGYTEKDLSYDKAGNLLALNRIGAGQLSYAYKNSSLSNQLQDISGYKTGGFIYDLNGNITTDGSRGITITYNVLDLPQSVSGNKNIAFTYDASGRKLRKIVTNPGSTITTDYVSGIQYTNGQLEFIGTQEGKVNLTSANPIYEYTLTDHLGNTTVSFDIFNGSARKLQEVNYYPFGYAVQRQQGNNTFLYNGKEFQSELDIYDYGARLYDPVTARWNGVDAMAEKYAGASPYSYANNNPIYYIDPDGNDPTSAQQAAIGRGYQHMFYISDVKAGKYGEVAQFRQFNYEIAKGLEKKLYNDIWRFGNNYPSGGSANKFSQVLGAGLKFFFRNFTPIGAVEAGIDAIGRGDTRGYWNSMASLFAQAAMIRVVGLETGNAKGASDIARSWQGRGSYAGIDNWRNITLQEGKYVVGGLPGQSNFYTTISGLSRTGLSATSLWEGLQVQPNAVLGYRGSVGIYEITRSTSAAFGTTYANPAFGGGGLPQIFIPNYNNLNLLTTFTLK